MCRTSAFRFGTVVAVAVATVVVVATSPVKVAVAGTEAVFDYSMPERYGLDHDGDGAIDSFVPTTTCDAGGVCTNHPATSNLALRPSSWRVYFDACANPGLVAFDWQVVSPPSVTIERRLGGGCDDFFADFPAEGTYRVGLRVKPLGGVTWGPWTWADVVVQDWLIISMGDSYGAGEGTPDVEIDPSSLPDVANAFADLGDAVAALADFGPCNAGTGFNFDACVTALAAAGNGAVDHAVSLIQQLNDPVCDITRLFDGFDIGACIGLLVNLAVTVAESTIEAVGAAVTATYDTYVARFQAAHDAAAALVDTLQTAVDNFEQGATWQDRRCHRSANAGASLAAMELERRDPRTSVTFVHVACSGAMIMQGLIDTYAGADDEVESAVLPPIPPQVHQVSELIGDREIDVVQLSIGGNDVNFGPMIYSCVLRVDCTRPNPFDDSLTTQQKVNAAKAAYCPSFVGLSVALQPIFANRCQEMFDAMAVDRLLGYDAQTLFDRGRNGDPGDPLRPGATVMYDLLDEALHRAPFHGPGTPDEPHEPGLGLPSDRDDRVYITEYVNPLVREDGGVCSFDDDGIAMIPGVSRSESSWLNDEIVPALQEVVRSGATQEHWNFITGIVDGFEGRFGHGHGYCAEPDATVATAFGPPADARFMVRLQDAFLRQGNKTGGVHPSRSGYRQYAEQILPAWLASLYDDSTQLIGPRHPDQVLHADAGPSRVLDEGQSLVLTNDSSGHGPLTFHWSSTSPAFSVAPATSPTPTLSAIDDGAGFLELSVADSRGGSATDRATVLVRNVAPTVSSSSATVVEGSVLSTSVGYSDPGVADTHTATVDYGAGPIGAAASGGSVVVNHTYPDQGSYRIGVAVTDDDGGVGTGTVDVTVTNAPPVVGEVTAPVAPVLVGTSVAVGAPFTDAGVLDAHTATVGWGDGTSSAATVTEASGAGSVAARHTYTTPGIYTVTVEVADGDGGAGSAQLSYVVVYDPSGGFASGAGIIESPPGAYRADPGATGRGIFALVSKYRRAATVPQGATAFVLRTAGFVFASTSYEWLVVSGTQATYKGSATVNGRGGYGFLLAVVDGDRLADPGPDRLRLKVWEMATGTIVYDNQLGAGDDAAASSAIAGGLIVVTRSMP